MSGKRLILKMFTCLFIIILVSMSVLAICAEPEATTAEPVSVNIGILAKLEGVDATMSTGAAVVSDNCYDRIISLSADAQPTGTIADMTILDDGTCYEFTLHKGIEFSNGDPMTAKDVEFSFNRIMEKSPNFVTQFKNFDHFEVVDDYTVRFYFTTTNVLFPYLNAPRIWIASKSYYDRVGEDEFVNNPVGSGPYKVVDWVLGDYADLEVNENYWGEKPEIQKARLYFVPEDTTRVAMLQAGEVDMVTDTPYQMVADLEADGFKRVDVKDNARTWELSFNLLNPDVPWADVRVRQAIAYAIDREAIAEKLFFGIPKVYAWLAPGELGYDPEIKPYPYDIEKAKQLLADAGYADGFEMPVYVVSTLIGSKEMTDYITSALAQIKIKCKIHTWATILEFLADSRAWHKDSTGVRSVQLLSTIIPCQVEPSNGLSFIFDGRAPSVLWNIPELNAVLDEMTVTQDRTERGELIKQAISIIDSELPMTTIMTNVSVFTMKSNIEWTSSEMDSGSVFLGLKDMKVK